MRKLTFIFAAMLVFSAIAYGQKESTSFAGTWNLDIEKSELGGRSRLKSMTMIVSQSESELSYERNAKREEGDGAGGGRGRRRGMGGAQALTYDLSGKETTAPGGRGGDAKLKAEMDGSNLELTQKREFNSPMGGEITVTTVEKWSLSEDGNILTIQSDSETPRGNRTSKMVFSRNAE